MKSLDRLSKILLLVLGLNHLIGLIGLHSIYSQIFTDLSWLNLLISLLVLLWIRGQTDIKTWSFYLFAFTTGMAVEVLGVNTGWPFGDYHYPSTLGIQFMGVPLIIGGNWLLMSLAVSGIAHRLSKHFVIAPLIGAALMALADVILEPFAIRHGLWVWHAQAHPPLQNYLAWFVTAWIIQQCMRYFGIKPGGKAETCYFLILLFFLAGDALIHLL